LEAARKGASARLLDLFDYVLILKFKPNSTNLYPELNVLLPHLDVFARCVRVRRSLSWPCRHSGSDPRSVQYQARYTIDLGKFSEQRLNHVRAKQSFSENLYLNRDVRVGDIRIHYVS
jgi:hypothetical protein